MIKTEIVDLLRKLSDAIGSSRRDIVVHIPGYHDPQEERIWYIDGDQLMDEISQIIETYDVKSRQLIS